MAERLHNTYQVANLLGVTPGTVARWIRNGELQFKRLPDEQVRITEKHLVTFLKKRGIDIEEVMAKAVLREGAESGATVTRGERPALMKPTEQGEPAESGAPTEPQTPSPTPPEPGTETPDPVEELAAEITGKTPAAPEGASQSEDSQPIELTEAPQGEPTAPAAEPEPATPAGIVSGESAKPQTEPARPEVKFAPTPPPTPAPATAPTATGGGQEAAAQVIEAVLRDAIAHQASYMHLAPGADGLSLQLRIDGVLQDKVNFKTRLPAGLEGALIAHLKSLAAIQTDICDKPQTGKFSIDEQGRRIQLHVATCPVTTGEKLTIRIVDPEIALPKLDELGLTDTDLAQIRRFLARPSGLIVAASANPTSTTATLHAMLGELDRSGRNFTAVTKDAALDIEGVTQSQVDPAAGFTFASAAQAVAAADADVILISELRDPRTATAAVEAALDGRMVLLGAAAPDAPQAVELLRQMGLEPWPLSSALLGVVAQASARTLCEQCKRQATPPAELTEQLGIPADKLTGPTFEPVGCPRCADTGYVGRVQIFSVMFMAPEVSAAIRSGASASEIATGARQGGIKTLLEAALEKVNQGVTSLGEIARIFPGA